MTRLSAMRHFSRWVVALGCWVAGGLSTSMVLAQAVPPALPVSAAVVPVAPFAGRQEVSYAELVEQVGRIADELGALETVRREHAALLAEYGLTEEQLPLSSFSRVRLVFEATRDGGLWGIRWAITDQMPWSDRIWSQWRTLPLERDAAGNETLPADAVTAVAECDELSALFALLARDLGVAGFVGLHWPTWNHTVAVWQLGGAQQHNWRIVVPTSQVFLSREATLGTREMPARRIVFPYGRADMKPSSKLPAPLARFLIGRLHELGAHTSSELQARRNALGGT